MKIHIILAIIFAIFIFEAFPFDRVEKSKSQGKARNKRTKMARYFTVCIYVEQEDNCTEVQIDVKNIKSAISDDQLRNLILNIIQKIQLKNH